MRHALKPSQYANERSAGETQRLWPWFADLWRQCAAAVLLHVALICQAITIAITWPLWTAREAPPNLPALPLPQFSMQWPLLASLAFILWKPKPGVWLHGAALLFAFAQDQIRIQPEIVSLWILMAASLPTAWSPTLGRAHLISMWLYTGIYKLLSPAYFSETSLWLYNDIFRNGRILSGAPEGGHVAFGAVLAAGELAIGLAAIIPLTRRFAAVGGMGLHFGILLTLLALGWNEAVWPWNFALAIASLALIGTWREGVRASWRATPWPGRVAAAVLLVSPAGYYAGLIDGYLAYCLYSSNVPKATFVPHAFSGEPRHDVTLSTLPTLNVPLPPARRLFLSYFRAVGEPGDQLIIRDHRCRWSDAAVEYLNWPPP